jgi:hypothetical protein
VVEALTKLTVRQYAVRCLIAYEFVLDEIRTLPDPNYGGRCRPPAVIRL